MALKQKINLRPLVNRRKTVSSYFRVPLPSKRVISKKAFIKLKFNTIFDASYAALMFSLSMPSKIISCLKAMFCSSPCILEVIVLRFRDQGIDGSEASVWDEEGKNINKKKSRKSSQRASSCLFVAHVASHTLRSRLATSNSQRLFTCFSIASFGLWVIIMGRIS